MGDRPGWKLGVADVADDEPRIPFSAFLYWLPGFLTAAAIGAGALVIGAIFGDIGGTAVLGGGLSVGAVIGYGLPFRRWGWAILIPAAVVGAVTGMRMLDPVTGLLCTLVIGFLCIPSAMIGAVIGRLVRGRVKRSGFSQAHFLPALLLAAGLVHGVLLEAAFRPARGVEEIATSGIVRASPAVIWSTHMFGDDEVAPPSVLRELGLPEPRGYDGRLSRVGDEEVCAFGDARLRLRVVVAEPPRELRFVVLEQRGFEDRSTQLLDGTVRLESVADVGTRVTFTTRHQPLIGPAWLWRPLERLFAHELHRHALREVRRAVGERVSADLDDE